MTRTIIIPQESGPPVFLIPSQEGERLSAADWAVVTAHPSYAQLVKLMSIVVRARAKRAAADKEAQTLYEASRETYTRARKAGAEAARRVGHSDARFDEKERARRAWGLARDRAIVELLRDLRDPAALDAAQAAENDAETAFCNAEAAHKAADAAEEAMRDAAMEAVDAVEGYPLRKSAGAAEAAAQAYREVKQAERALYAFRKEAIIDRFFKHL